MQNHLRQLYRNFFDAEASKIADSKLLARGTSCTNAIKSISAAGGDAVTIKSHHNVGGLPDDMALELVERLRVLFKDVVHDLGRQLGLPDTLVGRHPSPGLDLVIRIAGDITPEKLDILRELDAVYLDAIRKAGFYDVPCQAFAMFLPAKMVGLIGDARSYEYVFALRAVTSGDDMTANSYGFDHAFLSRVGNRILNEVKGVIRVFYEVTSKKFPGTIQWA